MSYQISSIETFLFVALTIKNTSVFRNNSQNTTEFYQIFHHSLSFQKTFAASARAKFTTMTRRGTATTKQIHVETIEIVIAGTATKQKNKMKNKKISPLSIENKTHVEQEGVGPIGGMGVGLGVGDGVGDGVGPVGHNGHLHVHDCFTLQKSRKFGFFFKKNRRCQGDFKLVIDSIFVLPSFTITFIR